MMHPGSLQPGVPFVPYAVTKFFVYPFTRYQLQQQATSGLSSDSLLTLIKNEQRSQGLLLDLACYFPPCILKYMFQSTSKSLCANIPDPLGIAQEVSDLPILMLSELINHPLRCIHQMQTLLNRDATILQVGGYLNYQPRLFYQGIFTSFIYEVAIRVMSFYIAKIKFLPSTFSRFVATLIASLILYPIRTVRTHQIDMAMFGKKKNIGESVVDVYGVAGIRGFWAGASMDTLNHLILASTVFIYKKFIS